MNKSIIHPVETAECGQEKKATNLLKKLNCTRMIMPTFVDYG